MVPLSGYGWLWCRPSWWLATTDSLYHQPSFQDWQKPAISSCTGHVFIVGPTDYEINWWLLVALISTFIKQTYKAIQRRQQNQPLIKKTNYKALFTDVLFNGSFDLKETNLGRTWPRLGGTFLGQVTEDLGCRSGGSQRKAEGVMRVIFFLDFLGPCGKTYSSEYFWVAGQFSKTFSFQLFCWNRWDT